jgi:hypothetical protein
MGLFEYLFERKNPGKVGSIHRNDQPVNHISVPLLILKLLISAFMIYSLFYLTVLHNFDLNTLMTFIIVLFIYCFISYVFIPKPDTSNVGLLGGLIDNPFRYTDDLNRTLILFMILMYPGRFIAITIIQTFKLITRRK